MKKRYIVIGGIVLLLFALVAGAYAGLTGRGGPYTAGETLFLAVGFPMYACLSFLGFAIFCGFLYFMYKLMTSGAEWHE